MGGETTMTLSDAASLLGVPMSALISDDESFEQTTFDDLFDSYDEEPYNNHVEVSKKERVM